jgi:hypothetical protein
VVPILEYYSSIPFLNTPAAGLMLRLKGTVAHQSPVLLHELLYLTGCCCLLNLEAATETIGSEK